MPTPSELITEISKFANVMSSQDAEFAAQVMREHRTIQQSIFGLFLKTIEEWSKQEHYDLRNEYTVQTSKEIMKLLDGCSGTPCI
jgi:hypothetical protein